MTTVWVDADACPRPVKDMLYRLAQRIKRPVVLVANQALSVPASPYIRAVQVPAGFDVADNYIVTHIQANDILISADIPLASEVLEKGAFVITPRGERLTADNIQARLTMRNFLEEMRSSGERTGGPPPFSNTDKQQFANALDRLIAKLCC